MKLQRGDVVIINHPFSDASGSKVRPALVVQSDSRNAILQETIIVLISKNLKYIGTDPTQLLNDIGTAAGKASGAKVNSAVKCGKLFTLDENMIHKKIGILSLQLMQQVNSRLKIALALP